MTTVEANGRLPGHSRTASRLVLASASPRRRELLEILLPQFEVCPSDIDEAIVPGESPSDYVCRMARQKAEAFDLRLFDGDRDRTWVLGSDTSVVVDSTVLGKPADAEQARLMLRQLSGRVHSVRSAVALRAPDNALTVTESVTRVTFERLPAEWIEAYVASGEPMDKAGAYAIQGAAAAWISDLQGSYSGVVGLPLFETAGLLRPAGLLDPGPLDR